MKLPEPPLLFALLGPLFLVLGTWRWLRAGRVVPQAQAWWTVGALFTAAAVWLGLH